MTTRRRFLWTAAATGMLGLGPSFGCASRPATVNPTADADAPQPAPSPPRPMDLLILGGTGFIGPHLVRHAVSRGHRVTIFTRGRRSAVLPAGVVHLIGDRNGQLDALAGKRWDAVVDDSATNPDWVRQSTQLLSDGVGRYLFTSSTGVYYPYLKTGADESTPVRTEATDPEDFSETYGVAKALCEREVLPDFAEAMRQAINPLAVESTTTIAASPARRTSVTPGNGFDTSPARARPGASAAANTSATAIGDR